MSEGPIKRWRDSWKPPTVTTRPGIALHYAIGTYRRAYCGRNGVTVTGIIDRVTCSECLAAMRADGIVS